MVLMGPLHVYELTFDIPLRSDNNGAVRRSVVR